MGTAAEAAAQICSVAATRSDLGPCYRWGRYVGGPERTADFRLDPQVSSSGECEAKLETRVPWSCRERDLSDAVLFPHPLPFCSFVHMSQRVHLVLSVSSGSGLGDTLQQSQSVCVVALGPLVPSSRAQLVREELALYGKRLEESPFNNQVGPRPRLVECGASQGASRIEVLRPLAAFLGLIFGFFQTSLPGGELVIR